MVLTVNHGTYFLNSIYREKSGTFLLGSTIHSAFVCLWSVWKPFLYYFLNWEETNVSSFGSRRTVRPIMTYVQNICMNNSSPVLIDGEMMHELLLWCRTVMRDTTKHEAVIGHDLNANTEALVSLSSTQDNWNCVPNAA